VNNDKVLLDFYQISSQYGKFSSVDSVDNGLGVGVGVGVGIGALYPLTPETVRAEGVGAGVGVPLLSEGGALLAGGPVTGTTTPDCGTGGTWTVLAVQRTSPT